MLHYIGEDLKRTLMTICKIKILKVIILFYNFPMLACRDGSRKLNGEGPKYINFFEAVP
jgi:hypothetical protein